MGFDVINQLSTLTGAQRVAIEEYLRKLPPEEPPLGAPSKLFPHGPNSGLAHANPDRESD